MVAKKKSVVAAPDLSVTVGDTVHYLSPSLASVRKITAFFGGIRPAFDRVRGLDFDGMAQVVVAGAGLQVVGKEYDDLVMAIWQHDDKATLGAELTTFLSVLLNGGRPLPKLDEDEGEGDEDKPGKS